MYLISNLHFLSMNNVMKIKQRCLVIYVRRRLIIIFINQRFEYFFFGDLNHSRRWFWVNRLRICIHLAWHFLLSFFTITFQRHVVSCTQQGRQREELRFSIMVALRVEWRNSIPHFDSLWGQSILKLKYHFFHFFEWKSNPQPAVILYAPTPQLASSHLPMRDIL